LRFQIGKPWRPQGERLPRLLPRASLPFSLTHTQASKHASTHARTHARTHSRNHPIPNKKKMPPVGVQIGQGRRLGWLGLVLGLGLSHSFFGAQFGAQFPREIALLSRPISPSPPPISRLHGVPDGPARAVIARDDGPARGARD
jgi:hypothetical protein